MTEVIKNYRNNSTLRQSFNELAEKTFAINFEDWYRNGFWGDNYNPYSIVRDGKVVANVSVNRTDMLFDGKVRHFLQLGTVMTDEAYRNQGLIRRIMEQIDADYIDKVEGIYLFGNDSVLDFYPKFGFRRSKEYQYSREVHNHGECRFEQLIMDTPARWKLLQDAMARSISHGRFDMTGNPELILFYVSKYMQENVYYHAPTDTYVIAEVEGDRLFLHNIFSSSLQEPEKIISLFGKEIRHATLGFVPPHAAGYQVTEFHKEDCTFFIKGSTLEIMEQERLRIPSLSHA